MMYLHVTLPHHTIVKIPRSDINISNLYSMHSKKKQTPCVVARSTLCIAKNPFFLRLCSRSILGQVFCYTSVQGTQFGRPTNGKGGGIHHNYEQFKSSLTKLGQVTFNTNAFGQRLDLSDPFCLVGSPSTKWGASMIAWVLSACNLYLFAFNWLKYLNIIPSLWTMLTILSLPGNHWSTSLPLPSALDFSNSALCLFPLLI